MPGFFEAVANHSFMRNALLAGLLASIACGVIGTYVVTRRISLIAGSLAHSVLGGMGAAYYLRVVHDLQWLHPLHGAIAAALLAAFIIAAVRTYSSEREDTVISALWAVGMAIGIVFLFRTPGYKTDLMTYLFGNIIMADTGALKMLIVLDLVVVVAGLVFYNQMLAVCFDEKFARIRGLRTGMYNTLLLCLTALTVVTLIYVVGIVLVIALLTLPVAIAGHFSRRLWQMMLLSALLSAIFTTLGLAISYEPDLPAGATTILIAGGTYATVKLLSGPSRRLKSAIKRQNRDTL